MEEAWGFHLSAIGHTKILPNQSYPPASHPAGRAFEWERGRVLPALQIVAVRAGRGEVEWTRERHRIGAGAVFLLLPGEWHRYRPERATGWTEDWFELRGEQVERWIRSGVLNGRLFRLSDAKAFFKAVDRLHASCLSGRASAAGLHGGLAMALLAEVLDAGAEGAAPKLQPGQRELVAEARERLRQGEGVNQVAAALGVSYLSLNRVFKKLTGIAPKAYAEQLRMARAEALLAGDQLTVKEIAAELGFYSANHFSAAFKKNYGISPRGWRGRVLSE
jgi:AraC-like DNA-binding protein